MIAADEEDPVAVQFRMAVNGTGHRLHGGEKTAVGLGEEGDGWVELHFHDKEQGARGISGRGKGVGRK